MIKREYRCLIYLCPCIIKIIYPRQIIMNREQWDRFLTIKRGNTMMENVDEKHRAKYIRLYLRIVKMGLNYIGTWPPMAGESFTDKTWRHIRFILNLLIVFTWTIQLLIHIFSHYTELNFAEDVGPLTFAISFYCKILCYRNYKKELNLLVVSLEACVKNENSEVHKFLADSGYNFKPFVAIYGVNFLALLICNAASPFIENMALPVDVWYPFDYRASLWLYALAYIEEWVVGSICFVNNNVEIAFLLFILHCMSQLKYIKKKLAQLTEGSKYNELSLIVQNHNQVLKEAEYINQLYSFLILVFFLLAVIAICAAGYQITSGTKDVRMLGFSFALASFYLQQLFLYYLLGELFYQETQSVGEGAYMDTLWYNCNEKIARSLKLIIFRSQGPSILKVGHLKELALENYAVFLSTVLSYFTTIYSMAHN